MFLLDLACLVSQRRVLCSLILCWLVRLIFQSFRRFWRSPCFVSLSCSVCLFACFCFSVLGCLISTWREFCVLRAFFCCVRRLPWRVLLLVSSNFLCRSAVGIGSICCGIFVRLCSTSHPGGNQVDGLPPAPSIVQK